jgi:hypothetical protein
MIFKTPLLVLFLYLRTASRLQGFQAYHGLKISGSKVAYVQFYPDEDYKLTFALWLEDQVQVGDNSKDLALNSVVGAAGFIFSTAKSVMIRNSDISKQNPSNWLSLSPWVLPFRFSQIHSRKIPQGRTVVSVFDQTRTIGIHRRFYQHKSSGLRRAFSTHHPLIGFGSPPRYSM